MKYLCLKLGLKTFALAEDQSFAIEPTQINKIVSNDNNGLLVGEINYRNKIIDVYDIATYFNEDALKKFDGIVFITTEEKTFGVKFSGFFKIEEYPNAKTILTIEDLLKIIGDE